PEVPPMPGDYGAATARDAIDDPHESSIDAEYEHYARRYPAYGDPVLDPPAEAEPGDRVSGYAGLRDADTERQEPVGLADPGPAEPDDPAPERSEDQRPSADEPREPSAPSEPHRPEPRPAEPYKRPKPVPYDRGMEAELAAWEPEDSERAERRDDDTED